MILKKFFSVYSFLQTRSEWAGYLLGSGRNRTRIFFFKSRSGWIRILDKNGNIQPDPDPDSESNTSLVDITSENKVCMMGQVYVSRNQLTKNFKITLPINILNNKFSSPTY